MQKFKVSVDVVTMHTLWLLSALPGLLYCIIMKHCLQCIILGSVIILPFHIEYCEHD